MTLLTVCDEVAKQIRRGTGLSSVVNSTDPFAQELYSFSTEAATDIAKGHDWRLLTTLATLTGDGATTDFSLPSDYDRMPVKANVFRSSTTRPMTPINDLDDWQYNRLQSFNNPNGEWIILGGLILVYPAMSNTDTAKFYYQSNLIIDPASGSNKTAFTIDTDVFRLPERLLKLSLIWRWKQSKGYDYAEDMQTYGVALAQEITRDKGSRMIGVGRARMPDVDLAYPGNIEA